MTTGGLTALHTKSIATGRVAGMREFIQDADERVAAQITATCTNGGDWGPGEQQTCMTAAALVVAKAQAGGGAAVPHAVVKGICGLPLEHFNGTAMRDIVFAWYWIVAAGVPLASTFSQRSSERNLCREPLSLCPVGKLNLQHI
jgi:hypothetical protein